MGDDYMAKLSEEARERKNERQREYAKRTGYAANRKYDKEQTKSIAIRFMKNTESDLLAWIELQENKAGYIKSLIREDMKRNNWHTETCMLEFILKKKRNNELNVWRCSFTIPPQIKRRKIS